MQVWAVYDEDAMELIYASPDKHKVVNRLLTEYNGRFGEEALTVEEVEESGYYRMYGPVTIDM